MHASDDADILIVKTIVASAVNNPSVLFGNVNAFFFSFLIPIQTINISNQYEPALQR